ncbi:MAG: adenosine deaminase [Thermoanaerobaculia bacterium]
MGILGPGSLADCHLHFEGSLPPEVLAQLARQAGHPFARNEAFQEARKAATDSRSFLDLFREVCGLMRTPEDYCLAARGIARELTAAGVAYFEVYVSPEIMGRFGVDAKACLAEIAAAFSGVEAEGGARGRILLDAVRQWGAEAAERVLDVHEATRLPAVIGFGLGGDENARPAAEFAGVYARARALGLRTSVHAGEWAGPGAVTEALDALRPDRIDHGIAAAADPKLMTRLAEEGTVLWVAPTSNVSTRAVAGWPDHPLRRLLDSGVAVALGADDPLLFETSTAGEYRAAAARLGVAEVELRRMAEHAWRGAFCPPDVREEGLGRLAEAPGPWAQRSGAS